MTGVAHQQADEKRTDQPTARKGWQCNHAYINEFRWLSKSSEKARVNASCQLKQLFTLFQTI
jgi:hypothetical protein